MKLQESGIIPGDLSPFFIANSDKEYHYSFGLLNSCVAPFMMRALNPTITTPTGDVSTFPVILCYDNYEKIADLVEQCVSIAIENSISYVCVDKLTGRRYEKSVAQDLSLLHRGVDIPLNEVV